jgi:hypothetical protein
MPVVSVNDANARRTIPLGANAVNGASSFAVPQVNRCAWPITFQVLGDISIRHRLVLSPVRAEKIATSRPKRVSLARFTSPMPPDPRSPLTS